MHILLIAYEFPPIAAAQALRWYHLANALAAQGANVEVIAPRVNDIWGHEWRLHPAVTVTRTFPGPFIGLSGWLGRNGMRPAAAAGADSAGRPALAERLYRIARRSLDQLLFPDVRSEWFPFAWSALRAAIAQRRPAVVISSHEPGVDLLLGLRARRRFGIPWVVDLADPLVAPYTPRWRRPLDAALERRVCVRADALLVTTPVLQSRIVADYGVARERVTLLSQGFVGAASPASDDRLEQAGTLDLVYTGNFYPGFRDPAELFAAVTQVPGVRLLVAGAGFESELRALGEQAVALGRLGPSECLGLQRRAGLLVNLGNRDNLQLPGKLFEYFGAGRPILHITQRAADDASAALVTSLERGVVVENRCDAIAAQLRALRERQLAGCLDAGFDLTPGRVRPWSWEAAGERLMQVCRTVAGAQ